MLLSFFTKYYQNWMIGQLGVVWQSNEIEEKLNFELVSIPHYFNHVRLKVEKWNSGRVEKH